MDSERATVPTIRVSATRYTDPVARRLVADALADLGRRYGGEGDETPVEAGEFLPPDGWFVLAWAGDEAVGCGGWRAHGAGVAELKRMYTVPAARGRGVARAVLTAIEDNARTAGRARMILECGSRQPEALAMYQRCGYRRIPNYGFYAAEEGCVSFGRQL